MSEKRRDSKGRILRIMNIREKMGNTNINIFGETKEKVFIRGR